MRKTNIFAAYLPQFHRIPENDEFWGDGFTDWVGVKAALPLFAGHNQPKIPLNENYYDLADLNAIKWQVELANKYCVDGFCIYHYWFKNSRKVLEKPAEIILNNTNLSIKYFLAWDNSSWIRSWSNIRGNSWAPQFDRDDGSQILLEYNLGTEKEWRGHFYYLLNFFRDERYYKIDNKPVFLIMKENNFDILSAMCSLWNKMAQREGFSGLHFITSMSKLRKNRLFDYQYTYEPIYSSWGARESVETRLESAFHIDIYQNRAFRYMYDYEKVWKKIIRNAKRNSNRRVYACGIVSYDDTPRRGRKAHILSGSTPELFEKYFAQLYDISSNSNKEILFLTAWNEWGEGAYLEPDTVNGYAYLEALKRAVDSCSG